MTAEAEGYAPLPKTLQETRDLLHLTVESFQRMRREMDELAGAVNTLFSAVGTYSKDGNADNLALVWGAVLPKMRAAIQAWEQAAAFPAELLPAAVYGVMQELAARAPAETGH